MRHGRTKENEESGRMRLICSMLLWWFLSLPWKWRRFVLEMSVDFYETTRCYVVEVFIALFTWARHWSLSWATVAPHCFKIHPICAWVFHVDSFLQTFCLLGCDAVECQPTFRRIMSPLSSGSSRAVVATGFMLASCSAYSSTLNMEVTCSSETSVEFQRTTRR
jgi:hypothetical protein